MQAVASPAVFDLRVSVPDLHAAALDDREYRRDLRPVVREMYVEDAEGGAEPRDYVDPDPAQQVEGDEDDGGRGGGAEVVPGAPKARPMAAAAQRLAAVVSPLTSRPRRMIAPVPRNPTPVTTWAAILAGSNWPPRPPLSSAARVNSANP